MKPKEPEPEATLPLSAEERRRRVKEVRKLAAELQMVENALRDAQARLPGLVERVARARTVIDANTAPVAAEEELPG